MAEIFPAFLKIEHQPNPAAGTAFVAEVGNMATAGGRAFTAFETEADRTLTGVQRRFEGFSAEAQRMIDRAMANVPDMGRLNLGVDEIRREADALQQKALAAHELAVATDLAAKEAGDHSRTARLQVAAMEAAAVEAEQAAVAARNYADAQEQVQQQLRQTEVRMGLWESANDNVIAATGSTKAGMQQLSYQLGDVATMFSLGAPPMQIFASQGTQVVQAVQLMTQSKAGLLGVLGGPWGIAMASAVTVIGSLGAAYLSSRDEVDSFTAALREQETQADRTAGALGRLRGLRRSSTEDDLMLLRVERNRIFDNLSQAEQNLARMGPRQPGGLEGLSGRQARRSGLEETIRDLRMDLAVAESDINATEYALARMAAESESAATSTTAVTRALSEEERALNAALEATNSYISSLEQEIGLIGASQGQIRQAEIARAMEAAATDEQRRRIDELNSAREEAITLQERRAALAADARAVEQFETETLQSLRDEISLLGLVGPARQRAALLLEEEAFKARLAEQGVLDVNSAWEEYLRLSTELLNGESVLGRERDEAELLVEELDRISSALGELGGVGGALGGVLDFASGRSVGGLLGILLDTGIGTRVDDEGRTVARTIGDELRDIFEINGPFGETLTTALRGAGTGLIASSALFGPQNALGQVTSALGGALGQAAGDALASTIGGTLGKAAGPIGAIVGSVAGGFLGDLIKGADRGSAIITGDRVSGFYGDTDEFKLAAGQLGKNALDALDRVADALGADLNSAAGRVSIGIRDGNYYVDPQGRGYTKSSKFPDLLGFGGDAEAAVRAAILDLINDGVIAGLTAAEQRLLKSGRDLEKTLQDVLDFRSVFDRLEKRRDPLGFELDELDDEFRDLRDLFDRAGASVEQWTDLEALYWDERGEIIEEAMERSLGQLRGFLDELTIGNSALSLNSRRSSAIANFDPLAARVAAGDESAYDDFVEAARVLLDIERNLFGSTEGYFDRLGQVTNLTQGALDGAEGAAFAASNRDDPFSARGGLNDDAGIRDGIDRLKELIANDTNSRLDAINQNLGTLIGAVRVGGGRRGISFGTLEASW